jgi:hypothetical protein
MICRNCGKRFYIKRSLHELFKRTEEYLCDKCYKKYPIELKITPLILEEYHCYILSMFSKKYYIDYNYFISEYSKIYFSSLNKKGYIILFFDYLYLSDNVIEILDLYSKLFNKNLYIITFNLRN